MKKMRRSLGVLTAVVLMLAFAEQASAFCVYNQTDKYIAVDQTGGHATGKGFTVSLLKQGEKACCHWTNKDCNKAGKRDSIVTFGVAYWYGGYHGICYDFPIKAGGALTVEGSGGNYRCVAHGY